MNKTKSLYFLYFLAFLSGSSALAHEVLYVKILSTYFGNLFYVSAAILTTFLFSLGIGQIYAKKFIKYIGEIEILIGALSISLVLFFSNFGFQLISKLTILQISYKFIIPIIFLILCVPVFLIGTSIPILSKIISAKRGKRIYKNFSSTYFFYNLGAAISILILEFVLFRELGLIKTVILVSGVNFIVGFILLTKKKFLKTIKIQDTNLKFSLFKKYLIPIFIISFCSGIYQLFFLKIINTIFGPLNENFAIFLFVSIFAISLSSIITSKRRIKLSPYIYVGALLVVLQFLLLEPFIMLWANLNSLNTSLIKITIIFFYALLPLLFFGASEPLIIKKHKISRTNQIGNILAISSFGNVTGYLFTIFFLYERIPDYAFPILMSTILLALFIYTTKNKKIKILVILTLILLTTLIFIPTIWPEKQLAIGYKALKNPEEIKKLTSSLEKIETFKKYDESIQILHFYDSSKWLVINGYLSLSFGNKQTTNLRESIVGLSPAIYSKNTNEALVLGLGSGITSGTTTQIYKNTKIAEINPAMLEIPKYFKNENMDILQNPNAKIELQDGIITLLNSEKKYDVIINTVTSPTYYSSSKLWTKEIFDLASSRLNEGGVFTGWFGGRLEEKGVLSMIKTLETSFQDCKYIYLSSGYFNFICSNEKIKSQNRTNDFWSKKILKLYSNFDEDIQISQFIENLEVNINLEKLNLTNIPLNTLDYPYLEFPKSSKTARIKPRHLMTIITEDSFIHYSNKNISQKCQAYKLIDPYFTSFFCKINP